MTGIITTLILVATLIVQAVVPARRQVVVLAGAALCAAIVLLSGTATMQQLYEGVPWNVLVILVSLGLFTQVVVRSEVFGLAAVKVAQISRGSEPRLLLLFASFMFVVSSVLNNLTALLLCLPVILTIMGNLAVSQRFVTLCLALVLVACNLGGAATPIGDFPAIVLLGTGAISFLDYLVRAAPACIVVFAAVSGAFAAVLASRKASERPSSFTFVSTALLAHMYRRTKLKWAVIIPAAAVFLAMLILWIIGDAWHLPPDIVSFLGVVTLLLLSRGTGERIARTEVDAEALVFFAALFFMVGAVTVCGVPSRVAEALLMLRQYPSVLLALFLLVVSLLTAVFSAGPAMAACLPIALELRSLYHSEDLYVSLALSVCAGSSLFLTAATSGPLAQTLVDRTKIVLREGSVAQFSFGGYLPYGLLGWCMTLVGAILYAEVFAVIRG